MLSKFSWGIRVWESEEEMFKIGFKLIRQWYYLWFVRNIVINFQNCPKLLKNLIFCGFLNLFRVTRISSDFQKNSIMFLTYIFDFICKWEGVTTFWKIMMIRAELCLSNLSVGKHAYSCVVWVTAFLIWRLCTSIRTHYVFFLFFPVSLMDHRISEIILQFGCNVHLITSDSQYTLSHLFQLRYLALCSFQISLPYFEKDGIKCHSNTSSVLALLSKSQ